MQLTIEQELKKENAQLRAKMAALKEQIETLKQLLNLNSRNSSKPPSQDQKPNRPSGQNRGGAKAGHQANQRQALPEERIDERKSCTADCCPKCGSEKLMSVGSARFHQHIEMKDGRCIVTEYHREKYRCPKCGRRFSAELPAGVGASPYGPGFQSTVAMMTGRYHLSKRDVGSLFKELFAIPVSCGAVCKIEARLTKSLEAPYQEIVDEVQRGAEVTHVDETGWRDRGRNHWIWLASTKVLSLFKIDQSRSRDARDRLLGPLFTTPIVTDRYSAYTNLEAPHQYCLSHLIRNLRRFEDSRGETGLLSREILKELHALFRTWRLYEQDEISRVQLRNRGSYRRRRVRSWLINGFISGNQKFSTFCSTLLHQYDRLWTFLRVPGMSPTNNQAERDLRYLVIKRKKNIGTQSLVGQQFIARFASVYQTLHKRGRSALKYLTENLICHQANLPSLPLLAP